MAFKVEDIFGDLVKDMGVPGVAAGVGAVVLAPLLIPAFAKVGKPVAKAAIKGSMFLYEKGKGVIEESGEIFEDLVAESKAELAEQQTQTAIETVQNPTE
ncbi:DUF5132 domain-containing protein [Lyngbya aestuarii]|uniref:DUF5132 domain-containing protein n=1 Tax=Lyngbya aestuarii TaxID=118322 RepID=UPI00403DC81E